MPKRLAVIGGGYRTRDGLSLVKARSEVTVIEYLDHITPGMDREISSEFKKILTKQGLILKWVPAIKFNLFNQVFQ